MIYFDKVTEIYSIVDVFCKDFHEGFLSIALSDLNVKH